MCDGCYPAGNSEKYGLKKLKDFTVSEGHGYPLIHNKRSAIVRVIGIAKILELKIQGCFKGQHVQTKSQ